MFESRSGCSNHIERCSRRGLTQQPADALEREVIAEGLFGRNGAATNTAFATERSENSFLRSDWFATEQRSEARSAIDGYQQDVGTLPRREECERSGDSAGADATLPSDDGDVGIDDPRWCQARQGTTIHGPKGNRTSCDLACHERVGRVPTVVLSRNSMQ